jgi:serine/threonine-protein kinase
MTSSPHLTPSGSPKIIPKTPKPIACTCSAVYWNKFTAEGLKKSVECNEQAIALDPNYALAYSGLANAYDVMGVNAHMPVSEAGPKAKKAAEMAVQIDNQLAEAHLALGAYKMFYEWDLNAAQREFNVAMQLDDTLPGPHELSCYILRAQRRFDEALKEANLAIERDPLSRLVMGDLGTVYRFAGDPETAIAINKKIIEMDPTFSDVHFENGLALSQAGRYDEAIEAIRNGLRYSGNSTHIKAGLGIVYARAGKKAEARKVISELLANAKANYVSPLDIALIYSAMKDADNAFAWLEKAMAEHSCWLFELNCDPDWAPIRDDPRFPDLAHRVGLE